MCIRKKILMEKYGGKEENSVHCLRVNSKILFKKRSKKMSSGKLCFLSNKEKG